MTDYVDLHSRDYSGTFIGVKSGSTVQPFHVEHVESRGRNSREDSVYFCGRLHSASDDQYFEIDVLDPNVVLDHVDLGMTRVGNSVGYIKRIPRRQWRRGFRMSNCHPACSFSPRFSSGGHSFYWSVFNPEYMTFEQAVAGCRSGNNRGFAISQDLAIVRHNDNCVMPMIQYRDSLIGYVDNEGDVHIREAFDSAIMRKLLNKFYTKGVYKHAKTK